MAHSSAGSLLAAMALLAAFLAPAAAQAAGGGSIGPGFVNVGTAAEAELFQMVLGAVTAASQAVLSGKPVQAGRVIAASAPPSATPDAVAQMFGQVLAASSLVEDADKSLGPPSVWQ